MPEDVLRQLARLTPSERAAAGGKAWNLARMIQAGFPVPTGFVVFPFAVLQDQRIRSVIQQAFDELKVEEVAVRSSADKEDGSERSYAGSFVSFLSVQRSSLLERIDQVRQSGLRLTEETHDVLAVVIQPMVKGQVSGVCFSRNPVEEGEDIVIEAVRGLGEGLVSGQVTPERYDVRRLGFDIKRKARPREPFANTYLLSHREVKRLAELTLELERLLHCPVDVEWTIQDGDIHLLQCRPITVLGPEGACTTDRKYHYVWSTTEPMWAMDLGFRTRAGLLPTRYRARSLWSFDDHLYAKIGSVYEYHVNAEQRAEFLPDSDEVDGYLDEAQTILEEQDLFFNKLQDRPVRGMVPGELVCLFDEACHFYCRMIGLYSATSSLVASGFIEQLRQVLAMDSALHLLELAEPDLMELEQRDWQLLCQREFADDLALAHVRKYPYLSLNLYSYAAVIAQMGDIHQEARRNGIRLGSLRNKFEREKLVQEQLELLRKIPGARSLLDRCHRMSAARMHIKRGWAGLGFFLIPFFEEVSARSAEQLSTLMELYRVEDIHRLILNNQPLSPATKEQRSLACVWHMKAGGLRELEGPEAERYFRELVDRAPEGTLRGTVASQGAAQGRVCVVHCNDSQSMRDGRRTFKDGDILVTEMAQPSMIDLMARSSAVITNEGGLLSHAAIVCRELRIPCVVGTISATKVLTSGQSVEITKHGEIRAAKL